MSGWGDPVVGGTVLRVPALQSPNFVAGTSGWQVKQNGDAEFNSITMPDGQGVSVFFAGTAPVTTHVGDLWYDTSNGLALSRWDGTSWVPYQIGTGAIASGSVTNALLAAAAVAASNIQDGTITATQINAAAGIVGTMLAGGTITATQLADAAVTPAKISSLTASLIGQLGVLNVNPFFTGGDTSGWYQSGGGGLAATSSPPSGCPYPWAGKITFSATGSHCGTSTVPTVAGQRYELQGWLYSATLSSIQIQVYSSIGYYSTHNITVTPGTWTPFAVTDTMPVSSTSYHAAFYNPTDLTDIYVAGVMVTPQIPGGIIEAGTVTASEIAANTITASEIAAGTITATEIASGTITAALLAAGIVVAGIVDATTITGATFVDNQSFVYSGTPALGNLIGSDSATAGTDSYGNAYIEGRVSYTGSGSTWIAVQIYQGQVNFLTNTSAGGVWTYAGGLSLSGSELVIAGPGFVHFSSPVDTIAALEPGTTSNPEIWHNFALLNGWVPQNASAPYRYRLLPNGDVEVQLQVNGGSATSGTIADLSTGYIPAGPAQFMNAHSSGLGASVIQFTSTSMNFTGFSTTAGQVIAFGTYSLS